MSEDRLIELALRHMDMKDEGADVDVRLAAARRYLVLLEEIAGDEAALPEHRKGAAACLEAERSFALMETPLALRTLAEIAADEEAPQAEREKARAAIADAAQGMAERGKDISHWIGADSSKPN
jgi:hypothetical protein